MVEEVVDDAAVDVDEVVRSMLASALPTILPPMDRYSTETVCSPVLEANVQGIEAAYGIHVELAKLEVFESAIVYAPVP